MKISVLYIENNINGFNSRIEIDESGFSKGIVQKYNSTWPTKSHSDTLPGSGWDGNNTKTDDYGHAGYGFFGCVINQWLMEEHH